MNPLYYVALADERSSSASTSMLKPSRLIGFLSIPSIGAWWLFPGWIFWPAFVLMTIIFAAAYATEYRRGPGNPVVWEWATNIGLILFVVAALVVICRY